MDTPVPFITVEDGDDLIVSFALGPHAEESLTLLRTPKYEGLLPETERGVTVGTGFGGPEKELLIRVSWGATSVHLYTNLREYRLDVRAVEQEELRHGRAVLAKMNYDHRIEVADV